LCFSGALSTISSGLNSLAAVLWEDVLKHMDYFNDLSPNKQGLVVKVIGLIYGLITVGMAFLAGSFSGLLAASLVVFGAASGPILGVFILGIFMPFVNKYVSKNSINYKLISRSYQYTLILAHILVCGILFSGCRYWSIIRAARRILDQSRCPSLGSKTHSIGI